MQHATLSLIITVRRIFSHSDAECTFHSSRRLYLQVRDLLDGHAADISDADLNHGVAQQLREALSIITTMIDKLE